MLYYGEYLVAHLDGGSRVSCPPPPAIEPKDFFNQLLIIHVCAKTSIVKH